MTTAKLTLNIPLLRKGVEWVEEQDALPAKTRAWFQGAWVIHENERVQDFQHAPGCGTAYCLAGWIASQIHPELAHSEEADVDGVILRTVDVAREALGISPYPMYFVHPLFNGSNTAQDIRRIAEELAGERL